jgi:hypothetical protein
MDVMLESDRRRVRLGKAIGQGGEGEVFLVDGYSDLVVKRYRKVPLPAEQDAKLRHMVTLGCPELFQHTAWPSDLVLSGDGSQLVGIAMRLVDGMVPIVHAYSLKHRLKTFPWKDWGFLLQVARNTSAAFESIHSRGHVIGDINEGNILVGSNSRVLLLDCDSFQVTANGEIFGCRVGVASFTPPELQNCSFAGRRRTIQHDAFGLAVLLFHLLFVGRHPFGGRPTRQDVTGELSSNIEQCRFAYAPDAASRGLVQPPKSLSLEFVPHPLRGMFVRAFTEEGSRVGRPTAAEWTRELDRALADIKVCSQHAGHVFPGHLVSCPWCVLAGKGLRHFPNQPVQPRSKSRGSPSQPAAAPSAREPHRLPPVSGRGSNRGTGSIGNTAGAKSAVKWQLVAAVSILAVTGGAMFGVIEGGRLLSPITSSKARVGLGNPGPQGPVASRDGDAESRGTPLPRAPTDGNHSGGGKPTQSDGSVSSDNVSSQGTRATGSYVPPVISSRPTPQTNPALPKPPSKSSAAGTKQRQQRPAPSAEGVLPDDVARSRRARALMLRDKIRSLCSEEILEAAVDNPSRAMKVFADARVDVRGASYLTKDQRAVLLRDIDTAIEKLLNSTRAGK